MKSITTLLRIKQREMDALKRQQGLLEAQREELYKTLDILAARLVQELKAAETLPGMASFFGDFSSAIKQRQEAVHGGIRLLDNELDRLAGLIREHFSEMKKYEIALANWKKRRDEAAARRSQQEMDEIAIRGYVRKDA
ncbi:MAG: hypothetical protein ACKVOE_03730 [Rickettsiales bacterium]